MLKDGLGGRIITDGCSNVVGFEESGEAGEVADAGDLGKDIGNGWLAEGNGTGGGKAGIAEEGGGCTVTKLCSEGCSIGEELEVSIIVGKGGSLARRDAGAHARGNVLVGGLIRRGGGAIGCVVGFGGEVAGIDGCSGVGGRVKFGGKF